MTKYSVKYPHVDLFDDQKKKPPKKVKEPKLDIPVVKKDLQRVGTASSACVTPTVPKIKQNFATLSRN